MKELLSAVSTNPQSEPIVGRETDMHKNRAGGYVFSIDDWARFDRFLILGTAGGTYYVDQREHTKDNIAIVKKVVAEDGMKAVDRIVEISTSGRAPKNDQALFSLAVAASFGSLMVKGYALSKLSSVARIGTHLFMFVAFLKEMRGFGRSVKSALSRWYTNDDPDRMAYQTTKYRQRHGWSHRDVLRVAHPKTENARLNDLFSWITHPDSYEVTEKTLPALRDFLAVQRPGLHAKQVAEEIRNRRITHDMLLTEHKASPEVWQALLDRYIPMTALIRNLPTLTRHGLLGEMSDNEGKVFARLTDPVGIRKARVHPFQVLLAADTYAAGKSARGKAVWRPNSTIVSALDQAFVSAFDNIEKTDKNIYLGLDVSSSMTFPPLMNSKTITPLKAEAALALCLMRTANRYVVKGFSGSWYTSKMQPLYWTNGTSLQHAIRDINSMQFGGTDCAMPMLDALENKIPVDTFIVLTDNETWAGGSHPAVALQKYRKTMNIPAKLIVVGMTATHSSIADPNDPGMLDIVGFDAATPRLVQEFV